MGQGSTYSCTLVVGLPPLSSPPTAKKPDPTAAPATRMRAKSIGGNGCQESAATPSHSSALLTTVPASLPPASTHLLFSAPDAAAQRVVGRSGAAVSSQVPPLSW